MSRETHLDRYLDRFTACLVTFQFIEEALRMFLARAEVLISRRLQELIPYKPDLKIKSDKKASLGTLIDRFSVYCEDQGLINELKGITKSRNDIAHQGLLLTFEESQDAHGIEQRSREVDEIKNNAERLLGEILEHNKRIDAVLGAMPSIHSTVY